MAAVATVMRRHVVTIAPETDFQEMARRLTEARVSALPVVDAERRVVGVVSAEDLLRASPGGFRYSQAASRVALGWARGRRAADVMTRPALTIGPEASVARAAELMESRHVKWLPVVDAERRLLGVVARSDLLEIFLAG